MKARTPRAPRAPKTIVSATTPDQEPVTFIEQRKEGVSYGVRAYGKSVKRNTSTAMDEFARLKHFAEVVVPILGEANRKELLEASAHPELMEQYKAFQEWRARMELARGAQGAREAR